MCIRDRALKGDPAGGHGRSVGTEHRAHDRPSPVGAYDQIGVDDLAVVELHGRAMAVYLNRMNAATEQEGAFDVDGEALEKKSAGNGHGGDAEAPGQAGRVQGEHDPTFDCSLFEPVYPGADAV